jgi:hypothetical protein
MTAQQLKKTLLCFGFICLAWLQAMQVNAQLNQSCAPPTNLRIYTYTMTWDVSPDALSYRLEYKPASSTVWTVIDNIIGSTYKATDLIPNTLYDWRVKSNCNFRLGKFAVAQFTSPVTCAHFINLTTTNSTPTSVTVNWTNTGSPIDIEGMIIQYKPVNDTIWEFVFSNSTYESAVLNNLLPGTNYDWRIYPLCRYPSTPDIYFTSQFTTPQACYSPPTGLVGETVNFCTDVRMSWNVVPGAANYTIEISKFGADDWILLENSFVGTVYNTSLPAGKYDWRVKSNCFTGGTLASRSTVLSVFKPRVCHQLRLSANGKTSVTEINLKKIKISPQPAMHQAGISFQAPNASLVFLTVSNSQGATVIRKKMNAYAGENQVLLDVSSLPNGFYIVHLQVGDVMETAKLVIQK